ncbi:hypothetical protein [Azospirillum sp. SYSU D00513]|uniref:hypothetical protein n=1 Tax=Azospirillum sp. SYSU D00513 TaxID=2812561 RepID=UPI001A95F150|nr:hypothetical protein [Azospirillum sp. SYSU D00513]
MTIRTTIAAAALSAFTLLSGTSFAADFASQLSEAQTAGQVAGRDLREAAIPALNAARSLHARGYQDQAQDQLSFARNVLGLSTSSARIALPVVAAPSLGDAGFDARLAEARSALSGASREIREAVTPSLNVAAALMGQGKTVQAQDYLNNARGKLGFSTREVIVASPAFEIPQIADAGIGSEAH